MEYGNLHLRINEIPAERGISKKKFASYACIWR